MVDGISGQERQKLNVDWTFWRKSHRSKQRTNWISKGNRKVGGHFSRGKIEAKVSIKEIV